MKTIYKIVKYIIKNNPSIKVPYYLTRAFVYQIFKRLTGGTISIKLFNGKKIFLYPNCNISTMFVYTNIPDKSEIDLLRDASDNKTVFLDIGANIGSYSVLLLDKVKEVYAFEPHPFTAKRCKMNFLLNGHNEKQVLELALSDSEGKIYFTDNKEQSSINKISNSQENSITVNVDTLDNFAQKFLSRDFNYIVKIDVEGFEKNVLRGGEFFFINYNVKIITFECFAESRKEVFEIIKSFGYIVSQIDDNNFYAVKKGK